MSLRSQGRWVRHEAVASIGEARSRLRRGLYVMHGLAVTACLLSLSQTVRANDVPVASAIELQNAIGSAQAGDTIVLADGVYALTGVSCTANGTDAAPITVRAANPLGAQVQMDALEGFKVSGAHWHFDGLVVQGVCAADADCEHAFHVTGAAEGFILRDSRVLDFNAQLKVNAAPDGNGVYQIPHGGRVEGCEIADTSPRETSSPVTKLNIDTGDNWIVRANWIHDFHKNGGDSVSYGAFMKSGGNNGLFERNLVVCTQDVSTGGVRIGLSFGGGGTAPQYCAPAFDANTPCAIEHTGGVMRNNIIVACSDVGIYLNRSRDTSVLHNTLFDTSGVDFRFDTTTGEASGNFMMGLIRARDGGTFSGSNNAESQPVDVFTALYANPGGLDFTITGDPSPLEIAPARTDVVDDYCARARPAGPIAIGALEHTLGSCDITPPTSGNGGAGGGGGGAGGASGSSGSAGAGAAGASGSGGGSGTAGNAGAAANAGAGGSSGTTAGNSGTAGSAATGGSAGASPSNGASTPSEDSGCGCKLPHAQAPRSSWVISLIGLTLGWARRRQRIVRKTT